MSPAEWLRKAGPLLAFIIFATANIGPALGHGGVSLSEDRCILDIGPHKFHFTGYQPERAQAEEFCEDIPYPGNVIIVLDQVDKDLRKMITDIRVIKDYKNLGTSARFEQLDGIKTLVKHTVYYKKPALYPGGSIKIETEFDKGRYIGMVIIRNPADKSEFVAIFPFTVGYGVAETILKYTGFVALLFLVFTGIYFTVVRAPRTPGISS